ncbi:tRNA (adenosine(37)-N6)-dimethylallyltransferase MiaA [Shimazuella sp. AN120528]|uniref:tRNA (adenosine(37)-N6)-dimethylallyltransferase MiaA n=1 Tax=Shimazuella soli TaxID=1892854 RepID=UPI001F112120|nr:tRNA (adenosine(37)-N6)-dimethylallyltransferase MiaA [Shimazuella soli]MCH5586395.1 tRNA (adenosine(37)-N6)-dimethylallyltransferase MiaA [Shimazuella soli]
MKPDLLVIVGPTGVGKTALSLSLAKAFHGEIISGDSMQVYLGMDIGTAKASPEEQSTIPHHLIDMLQPDESFSVQQYQEMARQKIVEIQNRNHLPILVGGTGLYIEAVVFEYQMAKVTENPAIRQELTELASKYGNEFLHQRLQQVDPTHARKLHPNDLRRIIRALEVYQLTGKPLSEQQHRSASPFEALWIGLTMPRLELYDQINRRVDQMLQMGLEKEVRQLLATGRFEKHTASQAIGYKEMIQYIKGNISYEEAVSSIKQGSRRYAKRQLSWFRRIPEIHWFDKTDVHAFIEINHLVAGKFPSYRE